MYSLSTKLKLLLLDKRVDINTQDNDGTGLIHSAIGGEALTLVRLVNIIEYGSRRNPPINLNIRTNSGITPLHYAILIGFHDAIPYLFTYTTSSNIIVRTNIDVDAVDTDGNTALMLMKRNNDIRFANILYKAGADVSIKNNDGKSLL